MNLQNQYLSYAYDFATYLTYRLGSLLQQCQSSRLSFSQSVPPQKSLKSGA